MPRSSFGNVSAEHKGESEDDDADCAIDHNESVLKKYGEQLKIGTIGEKAKL